MEGRARTILHVCLLLPRLKFEGDSERREAQGGAEGTLCVQVQIPTIHCFMAPCLQVFSAVNLDVHMLLDTTLTKTTEVNSLELLSILICLTGKHITCIK